MLCIWWDQKGIVYYELLNPNETVTADRYERQLDKLTNALTQKRPLIASKHHKSVWQIYASGMPKKCGNGWMTGLPQKMKTFLDAESISYQKGGKRL
ncbi:unnamed protein product [Haemonchus placei]|uniref:Transposase n=1 Tax=Haemonchus placei TaxID=6290 RepID=A0A0N4WTG8_HAEPC|nr:unnamed protein product [Haemonchus placei]